MKTSYQVLCRVAMCHAYFTDGLLRGLLAQPTAATAERLRRTGLLLRPLPTGFEILYAGEADAPPPAGLRVAFPLVFTLQPPAPDFAIYTDLPAAASPVPPGAVGIRYLAPVPAPEPRLHQGPVMSEADQLPLLPLTFQRVVPPGVSKATLWHYPDGPAVWKMTELPAGQPLLINLRAEGPGAFELRLGDAQPEVFVAADVAPVACPWAMLELGVVVLDTPGATYTLSLAVRSTYWQYQLVSQRKLPAGLVLDTGEGGISFDEAPPLPGAVASFLAATAQPLAERYPGLAYRLLLPETGRASQVIYSALPHASAQSLRQKNSSTNLPMITDIFVHL
jgi:hypothetical protein